MKCLPACTYQGGCLPSHVKCVLACACEWMHLCVSVWLNMPCLDGDASIRLYMRGHLRVRWHVFLPPSQTSVPLPPGSPCAQAHNCKHRHAFPLSVAGRMETRHVWTVSSPSGERGAELCRRTRELAVCCDEATNPSPSSSKMRRCTAKRPDRASMARGNFDARNKS